MRKILLLILIFLSANVFGGTFTSISSGQYYQKSIWEVTDDADGYPDGDDNVTISAGHVVTVNGTAYGNIIVNGTFCIDGNSGTVSGSISYSSGAILKLINLSGYWIGESTSFWPSTNGPSNIVIESGSIYMNTTRAINGYLQINQGGIVGKASAAGILNYGENSTLVINYTTAIFYADPINDLLNCGWSASNGPTNVTVMGYGVNMGAGRTIQGKLTMSANIDQVWRLIIVGELEYNSGSFLNNAFPQYSGTPTLRIKTAKTLGNEWATGSSVTYGVPYNVEIDCGVGNEVNWTSDDSRTVNGNLTITSGSFKCGSTSNGNLVVKGNVVSIDGGINTNNRQIEFSGTSTQNVSGALTADYCLINNSHNVNLNSNFTVNKALNLTSGNIVTGANKVIFASTCANPTETSASHIHGNAEVQSRTVGTNDFSFLGVGLTGTGDAGNVSFIRTTGSAFTANSNSGINVKWDITSSGTHTDKNLTLSWLSTYDNGFTFNSTNKGVVWGSADANDFTKVGNPSDVSSSRTITVPFANYKYWTITDETTPLPVELSSFTAVVSKNMVNLEWATATEINNYGFEVEKSADKTNWNKIGFVNGNGNSNSVKYYSYSDKDNTTNSTVYYRLKQLDNNGGYEYSNVVEANINMPVKFELGQNFPNPFNPTTKINYSIPEASSVKLTIYNAIGQVVNVINDGFKSAGSYTLEVDGSRFNSGVYFYKLEAGNNTQIRKMVLVK